MQISLISLDKPDLSLITAFTKNISYLSTKATKG